MKPLPKYAPCGGRSYQDCDVEQLIAEVAAVRFWQRVYVAAVRAHCTASRAHDEADTALRDYRTLKESL